MRKIGLLLVAVALLAALGVVLSLSRPLAAPAPAAVVPPGEMRSFADQHARLVWSRQVVGNNDDPFVLGDNFHLMGFDNQDGAGERVLLPETGNYCRPLLTPDGEHVLYTDRGEGMIYVLGFDGSGRRPLTDGLAVDAWRDPETGVEWVYAVANPKHETTTEGRPLFRFKLEDSGVRETVWDQSPVTTDNLQVSRDGKWAAGQFPWPQAGRIDLESGKWSRAGKGCWSSMAPDNSYMMWIFDGAHKNLLLNVPGVRFTRKIRLNTAPGTEGHEVYHPRWSNHVRFMVMTGPYKVMAEYNAIHGGGKGINVYVGEFDEKFTAVRAWTQITNCDAGDFFPDLWVGGGQDAAADLEVPSILADVAPSDTWPGNHDGLVFAWENAGADNQVNDTKNGVRRACTMRREGQALFGPGYIADVRKGSLLAEGAGIHLADACRKSNAFSLELVIHPVAGPRPLGAPIVSSMDAEGRGNFVLMEKNRELYFILHTEHDDFTARRAQHLLSLSPTHANHIVVTYRAGELAWYLNGNLAVTSPDLQGGLQVWKPYPVVLGRTVDGAVDWPGYLEAFALYSRDLSAEEVAAHFGYLKQKLAQREPPARVRIEGRLVQMTPTPAPASIAPYRAGLVEYVYDVVMVLRGELADEQIIVKHWGILDAEVLPLNRKLGEIYTLDLENILDHPELEAERSSSEVDDPTLETYLDVGWKDLGP